MWGVVTKSAVFSKIATKFITYSFLRTVPSFGTLHTFCTSQDGPRKPSFLMAVPVLSKQRCICVGDNCAGKADLGKLGYWNSKRKLGVTMHFSEITRPDWDNGIVWVTKIAWCCFGSILALHYLSSYWKLICDNVMMDHTHIIHAWLTFSILVM